MTCFFKFGSLKEVWDVLDVSYKNLNEEEEAREEMSNLKQANLPFGWFLAEFQRLHNLSCISDDKTLISFMRNGVSNEMRTCISQHQDIHKKYTFDEYVTLCKECVMRLDLEKPSKIQKSSQTNRGIVNSIQDYHPIQTIRPSHNAHSVASGANNVPLGGDPMILDQTNISHMGPDGHITNEERMRRFKLSLCMRCGRPGHRAESCSPKSKKECRQIDS